LSSSQTVQPEIQQEAITVPIDRIQSIGFSPDGKFLVIKTNGVSNKVGIDDMLTFSDTSSTAQTLSVDLHRELTHLPWVRIQRKLTL
jgi:hypothetical protein